MPPDQLSTTPAVAAMLYHQGLALLLRGRAVDAMHILKVAIALDDQFAVAHAALAVAQAEVLEADCWRRSIDRATRQRNVSRRERQHVAVIALALEGRLARASALGREHLLEFPGDDAVSHVLAMRGTDLDDLQVGERSPG